MTQSRPSILHLVRRMADCPAEFLLPPRSSSKGLRGGQVDVAAVVSDLFVALGVPLGVPEATAAVWQKAPAADRNLLRVTLIACWLAADDCVGAIPGVTERLLRWLLSGLKPLAELVDAEMFVTDQDRREELVRSLLFALETVPEGETQKQAEDRLQALSSVERARILRDTRAAQARARELREKMASQRASEAAARYSSE